MVIRRRRKNRKPLKDTRHGFKFLRERIEFLERSLDEALEARAKYNKGYDEVRHLLDAWARRTPHPTYWLTRLEKAFEETGGYEAGPGLKDAHWPAWKQSAVSLKEAPKESPSDMLKRKHKQEREDLQALDGWKPYGDDDDWGLA